MACGLDLCVCVNFGHPSACANDTEKEQGTHSSRQTASVAFVNTHHAHTGLPLYFYIQGELVDRAHLSSLGENTVSELPFPRL